jgi:hypothetical protein
MSKIIIGIHGLGNKPDSKLLALNWKSAIQEGLEGKGRFWFLRFQLVYWASILHPEPYNNLLLNRKDPLYLKEPYIRAVNNLNKPEKKVKSLFFRDKLNAQLDKIFLEKDGSLNFSGLSDFIMRHFVKDLDAYYQDLPGVKEDQQPREKIRRKLAEVLWKNRRKKIFLIAHSMGSIIAWDVLTKYVPKVKIHTLVTIGSPLGNPVIRSKMFSDLKGGPEAIPLLRTPENIQKAWYNLSDFRDRVAINYDLKDDFHSNSANVHVQDKLVWNNYEYEGIQNPHKSYGYLRCQEMANLISDFLKWELPLFHISRQKVQKVI